MRRPHDPPTTTSSEGVPTPAHPSWSAIATGAVLGTALLLVLVGLWEAIARSDVDVWWSDDSLRWWTVGTLAFATAVGACVAGWLADDRGSGPGALRGAIVWALVAIAATALDLGSAEATPWSTVAGSAIGLVPALVAGAVGGRLRRPRCLAGPESRGRATPSAHRLDRQAAARRAPLEPTVSGRRPGVARARRPR